MPFEDQWAAARQQAKSRMQLNSEADINGRRIDPNAGPSLDVTPSLLQARGHAASVVRGDFLEADNKAVQAIRKAPAGLKGWDTAAALQEFASRWASQMRHVGHILEGGVATPLQQAGRGHAKNEDERKMKIRSEVVKGQGR